MTTITSIAVATTNTVDFPSGSASLYIGYLGVFNLNSSNVIMGTLANAANVPSAGVAYKDSGPNSRSGNRLKWSKNGQYLATGLTNGEVLVYYRGGNVLVRVDDGSLGNLATSQRVNAIDWNENGTTLAIGFNLSPFIKLYNFTGNTASGNVAANTFTQITSVSSLPGSFPFGAIQNVVWSPRTYWLNVESLSIMSTGVGNTAGRLRIWNRTLDTDSFSQDVQKPATQSGGATSSLAFSAWSPDGNIIITGGGNSGSYHRIYQRTGVTTYSVGTFAEAGVTGTSAPMAAKFSPDGTAFAIARYNGNVTIYSVSGKVATRTFDHPGLPGSDGLINDVAWNATSTILAAVGPSSPGITLLGRNGTTYTTLGSISAGNIDLVDVGAVTMVDFDIPVVVGNDVFGNVDISSAFSLTSAGGKLFLAGTTITSVFNTAQTADKFKAGSLTAVSTTTLTSIANTIKSAAVDMQAFDTVLYTGGRLQRGSVVILSSLTLSALSVRVKPADAILTSSTSLSADWNYDHNYVEVGYFTVDYVIGVGVVKPAEAALSTAASLTSTAAKVKNIISALTAAITLSATASRTARTTLTAVSAVSLTSSAAVILNATVTLSAFNTVVSAGGRIRPVVDLTASQAILTASASMIRRGVISYTDPEAPTGIIVDSTHITALTGFFPAIGGDFTNNGITMESPLAITDIAFWIKITTPQVIWSSIRIDSPATNTYTSYVFSYTNVGFTLVTNYITSWGLDANYPTVTTTLTWGIGSLGDGWNHIYLHITGSAKALYVNSDPAAVGTGVSPGAMQLSQPIIIGAVQTKSGQNTHVYTGDNGNFQLAQFWAGRATNSQTATPTAFYNETAAWTGSLGYYNLGANGHDGFNTTFDKVYFYNELNYPYANGRLSPGEARGNFTNGIGSASLLSPYVTTDQSFIPGWLARTATTFADEIIPYYPARFRLFSQGGQIRGGALIANAAFALTTTPYNFTKAQAALSSAATLTARISYKKSAASAITAVATITASLTKLLSSSASLTCQATLTANTYQFTKAGTAISSAFTLSADPDEISSGILLSLGSFSITASGATTKRASTVLLSAVTLTANGADKNMGEAVLFTAFTFSATSRVVYPIRPEAMTMSAAFSVSPTSNRFRDSLVPLTSAWTFANGITRAIRRGVVSMSAFDTVLSAGKIIEFLAENTTVVTEEQRRLRVALESTVLLVQMSNGVNTITAETTEVVVPQEQGVLLAQYNIPTN